VLAIVLTVPEDVRAEVSAMVPISFTLGAKSVRIPAWLTDALLILVVGLAILMLRDAGYLAPDLTPALYW
jgi:hypothetical protein